MFRRIWAVASVLTMAAGSFSIVLLIKQGFDIGFVVPLEMMLDYYHRMVGFLLGWAEPYLGAALAKVGSWFDFNLHLDPHWRHVFVLMWLYFGANARTHWSMGIKGSGVFRAIWGGIIALVASVGSGAVSASDATSSMLAAAIPILGIVLFELSNSIWTATFHRKASTTWWQSLRAMARYDLSYLAIGLVGLTLGTQADKIPYLQQVPNPGLMFLGIFVIAFALFWIWLGTQSDSPSSFSHEGKRWRETGEARLGFAILTVILGATLFVALNAGLKLVAL